VKIAPDQANAKQSTIIGYDARVLAGYAYQDGLLDDASYAYLLPPDKTCLSVQGAALYSKLVKRWDSGGMLIAEAPANATNTGMENSKLVVNAQSGITGDRTALERIYPGGNATYTLARCGNPVLPGKPKHVPIGKTEQHPPKETPPTSTTTPLVTTPSSSTPPATSLPSTPSTHPSTRPSTPSTPPTTTPTTPPTTSPTTPSTTPSTTPHTTPSTTPPTTSSTTPPKGPVPYPTDEPSDNKTPDPVETTAPVESHPADPSTTPGSEATEIPAPGATSAPTPQPTQPATGAPTDGTGTPDPDQSSAPPASMTAVFPFWGFVVCLLAWGFQRRRDNKAAARQ